MLKMLLYPLAMLYGLVTRLRNYMYDKQLKPVAEFDLPVICVGNLTVGGTGKTPMVEYIVSLLKTKYRVATLSRGYGRATKGFRLADASDSPTTIGDEPFQIYMKFRDEVIVAVGEERALAVPMILQEHEADVIVLDDAYQHRKVKPSFSILLSDYNRPFYRDHLLPAGRLRESRKGASRADAVVVTKCPADLSTEEQHRIEKAIHAYTQVPVFFAAMHYESPLSFGGPLSAPSTEIILVTGIASATPLLNHVSATHRVIKHFDYPDHRNYTLADLESIFAEVIKHPGAMVVTTEKDMVKLKSGQLAVWLEKIPFYYIPITVQFLKGANAFDGLILDEVQKKQS